MNFHTFPTILYTSEERNAENLARAKRAALALATPANRSIFTTWRVIFIVFTDPDFLRLGRDTRDKHRREACDCNPLPVLRFLARVPSQRSKSPSVRVDRASSSSSPPSPFLFIQLPRTHRSTSMCLLNRERPINGIFTTWPSIASIFFPFFFSFIVDLLHHTNE